MFWIPAGIILTAIAYFGIRYIYWNLIETNPNCTDNDILRHRYIFNNIKVIIVIIWLFVIPLYFLFFVGGERHNSPDNGATYTQSEVEDIIVRTVKDIIILNQATLKRKEDQIENDVKLDQQKSIDDYNKFLEKNK